MAKRKSPKSVENFTHNEASRKNIPTAEVEPLMREEDKTPLLVAYERRNPDLDPQLVWRGKDLLERSDLVVPAPPLYIQEKIHPKVLIDELQRMTEAQEQQGVPQQMDLFANFNGLPNEKAKTEFYQHDANWSNRMILGDSLHVMASLAEREGLKGQVQCIYIDPPYGIKFNSNFQWSTTTRDVKDGKSDHITREPEQVKAFRDTWRDGVHSYLTYLQDRILVARDLLSSSGSIFIQIGDENAHRVRTILDEVFGEDNFVSEIRFKTSSGFETKLISNLYDRVIWYAKNIQQLKFRHLFEEKQTGTDTYYDTVELSTGETKKVRQGERIPDGAKFIIRQPLVSSGESKNLSYKIKYHGKHFWCGSNRHWKTSIEGMTRLVKSNRIHSSQITLKFKRYHNDYPVTTVDNNWDDTVSLITKNYVVETNPKVIERCILMTTDPGDLIIDPTCGSGTSAFVSEYWGRRWITIDTSRVALALARTRVMGAKYPYHILKDSEQGSIKEAEINKSIPSDVPIFNDIRQGFVYEKVPHIMLKAIANNAEVDVIWGKFQDKMEPNRKRLNFILGKNWEYWDLPRESKKDWSKEVVDLHRTWWELRIARQKEIDASIAAKSEFEFLYDKPYEDNSKVRVAGPFTVENLSPHRMLGVDENDELIDNLAEGKTGYDGGQSFTQMVLDNLKTAGVQQAHKEDRINFASLVPWPGELICAEGKYYKGKEETGAQKRAAIFLGPEFGTVTRPDLVAAAREAADAGFDVLIACAFNFDAQSTEFDKLGKVPVLKARMNADLHMAEDLKNTGKGNLFVIFGEPDIDILDVEDGQVQVKINGVDVFDPSTGEVRSDNADGIACWFIDTDYNEESFFVRHAYFLGANDPYKSLKTTLRAEINYEAWESLHSDTSRPFVKPQSGRIAVKVINHLGDEVMKVFRV